MLPDVERIGLWWGPGIAVLVIFGYGVLRLAHYWIEKSHEVKRQQVESIFSLTRQYIEQFLHSQSAQADALSRLASSVEHRESVESFEHQEILIALKAIHRDLDSVDCRRSGGRNLPSAARRAKEGGATAQPPACPGKRQPSSWRVANDDPKPAS